MELEKTETCEPLLAVAISGDAEHSFKFSEAELLDVLPDAKDTRCGIWKCHPKWMRKLATPKMYLLIFTLLFWSLNTFSNYTTGSITTIQKRFKFSSRVSGTIMIGRELVQVFLAIPLSQVAGKGHRPRWLSFGLILAMIACVLMNLPHFIFGSGGNERWTDLLKNDTHKAKGITNLCIESSEDTSECSTDISQYDVEFYVVVILQFTAQMLFGVCLLYTYTIGYSYMDESVEKKKSPIFFAISGAVRVLGPLTGSWLSAWTLSYWVDLSYSPNISNKHAQWIGAWWLGYFFVLGQMILTLIGMLQLPQMLPGTRSRILKKFQALANISRDEFMIFKESLRSKTPQSKALWASLKRLLCNKVYMVLNVHQFLFWSTMIGVLVFTAKYMENVFMISAGDAMKYIGTVSIICTTLGWITMGSIMSFLKPSTKVNLSIGAAISLSMACVFFIMMNVNCTQTPIHGIEWAKVLQKSQSSTLSPNGHNCTADCQCDDVFSPVCVQYDSCSLTGKVESKNFLSPCYAGCSEVNQDESGRNVYSNCECAQKYMKNNITMVSDGLCTNQCCSLIMYLVLIGIIQFLMAAGRSIRNIAYFRCVDERDKDLSLGILCVLVSSASGCYLPLFGNLIDSCCALWERTCGTRGHCYVYDNIKFGNIHHGIPAVAQLLCMLCEILLIRWHSDLDLLGTKEEQHLGLANMKDSDKTIATPNTK